MPFLGVKYEPMDITLTDSNFDEELKKATTPILVDFWAAWCGPCRLVAPIVENISQELAGKLTVGKVDVDANPATSAKFGVMSIPTIIVFKNGQPVKQLVGYQSRENLLKAISEVISS